MSHTKPLPHGFSIRPANMQDLNEAVDLFNLCSVEMIGSEQFNVPMIENDWQTPGFNQETDQRVVFSPEGKMVGYTEVWAINENPVHPWIWGRVHPDYKGLGIGSHLLAWSEARARQVLDIVPPDARVSFYAGTAADFQPAIDLLSSYGMTLIRHSFQMRIEMDAQPPTPRWPEGIQVRTFRKEDAEAVYRADDEAFADHFGHVHESFETGFERFKHFFFEDKNFDPNLWFLAMDGDQIAGISLCRFKSWEDENMGWVSSLAVRRPWRRRGLGLALLQHSFGQLWKRGQKTVGLGVDAENLTGALRLYEKAGMHVHRQRNLYEKELRPGRELATVSLNTVEESV